jgi:hypothetical protein
MTLSAYFEKLTLANRREHRTDLGLTGRTGSGTTLQMLSHILVPKQVGQTFSTDHKVFQY